VTNATHSSVLEAVNLSVVYRLGASTVHAITDASLLVKEGEAVGLVGESGSGKSSLARTAMGLLPEGRAAITSGKVLVAGRDATGWREAEWQQVRGRVVSIVFQDPLSFLNPVLRVGRQIDEAVAPSDPDRANRARVRELLDLVRLPGRVESAYPHELSGGMRQRALLAIALASRPRLLIADEPTTALDVTVQAEILQLLSDIKAQVNMSLLLISHDLRVVSGLCSRVYVMYAGRTVEYGSRREVFGSPQHPYTVGLIAAATVSKNPDGSYSTIEGEPPNLSVVTKGCPFEPRCPFAMEICRREMPPVFPSVESQHGTRCWLLRPDKDKN
jgi:oligopeptide/dipeptide ABC transporter ATP-binding protein